jgi:parvulin-like peptidyl-prolyl isomerase
MVPAICATKESPLRGAIFRRHSLVVATIALWGAACHPGKGGGGRRNDSTPVLARAGSEVLTVGEFSALIHRQASGVSPEQKRALLDKEVQLMVMADKAARLGLDQSPEVVRARRQQAAALLVHHEIDDKGTAVSDSAVQGYFERHKGEFARPEEVRVADLFVNDRARAEIVAASARSARRADPAADERAFRELVQQHPEDPRAKITRGDLGFMRKGDPNQDPDLVEAAMALSSPGDVSPVVKVRGTYHVLKLLARRAAVTRSFNDVADQIRQKLAREERQRQLDRVLEDARNEVSVEIFDRHLDEVN